MSRVPTPPPSPPTAAQSPSDDSVAGAVPGGAVPEDDAALSHDHTLKWVLSDHMDLGETPEPVPEPPFPQPKFVVGENTPTILSIPKGAKTPPPYNYTLAERGAAAVTPTIVPTAPEISAATATPYKAVTPTVRHILEATPAPVINQPAAAPLPNIAGVIAQQKTPAPDVIRPAVMPAPQAEFTTSGVADAYLDLGATPSDFFTADSTPAPGQTLEEPVAAAVATAPSPTSGSDSAEVPADSVELLTPRADKITPKQDTSAAPEARAAVVPAAPVEVIDSQGLEAREVEPEAVIMMADSSEHVLDALATPAKPPITATPPPVPPEVALAAPPRPAAVESAPRIVPEPSPPPQVLAATLFEEYQTPASASDEVPEALARRSLQRRTKPWYEEVFDDDYLRTVPFMTPDQTSREVDFIRDGLALKSGSEVLDVACGYGRHAVGLAQQGFRVTGLDLSLPLLIKAADHAQKRGLSVNFVHADMREMTFNNQFDASYCVLSSFGYFDEETNLKVATAICRSLKPGGRFILDIINRDYIVGDLPSRVWWEGDGCVILEEVDFNYHTSRVLIRRSVVFGSGRQSEQQISLRAYSLHEVGRLLRQAGLRVLDVSGGLATKSRFFGAASRSIIALCERPLP